MISSVNILLCMYDGIDKYNDDSLTIEPSREKRGLPTSHRISLGLNIFCF